jgi:hypothetical protein
LSPPKRSSLTAVRGYLRAWRQNLAVVVAILFAVGIVVAVVVLARTGHHPSPNGPALGHG